MDPNDFTSQIVADVIQGHGEMVMRSLVALPFAMALGAALAFRPRRRGTPPRSASVIQTQIVLAVVGSLVMLVVGSSLARAFGIVGAANLIRYRAKIDDPKDAVVMLSTLSLGLACGVGLYGLAVVGLIFLLAVLWLVESLEPEMRKVFDLKVTANEPAIVRQPIENILRRNHIDFELRSLGAKELMYEAELPLTTRTDRVANAIMALAGTDNETSVEWAEKKKK